MIPSSFLSFRLPNIAKAVPFGALVLTTLAACSDKAAGGPRAQEAVPVKTAVVVRRDVPIQVRAVGHVEPITTVTVRSQVTGILERIHIREGQTVAKGALLFEIDPRPYRAALAEAEARLERDRALARKAVEDVKRNSDLVKKEYITQEQYASIQANAQALDAVVKADEAAVEGANLDLAYCTIHSPLAGRAGALPVHEGNLVKANDEALAVIHQIRPVYAAFSVPGRDLHRIRQAVASGTVPVEIAPAEGGTPSAGTLKFVDNAVDLATGSIQMKALLPNDDERLWPGQFVNATLTLATLTGAAVVPAQAVQAGQQGTFVYVVLPDHTVEFRPVKTAPGPDGLLVIESGAAPGETVVTEGHLRLVPGAKVSVLEGIPAP